MASIFSRLFFYARVKLHVYTYAFTSTSRLGIFFSKSISSAHTFLPLASSPNKQSGHLSIPTHMNLSDSVTAARHSIERMLQNYSHSSLMVALWTDLLFAAVNPCTWSSVHLWIFRRLESQGWTDWSRGPAHLSRSRNGQISSKELYPSSAPRPPESTLVSPGLPRTAQQSPRLLLLQGSLTSTLSLLLSGEPPALRPPRGCK